MIIAQITDLHMTVPGRLLYGGYDPRAALRETLTALSELRPRPDVVLFTGDVTEGGLPEEFEAALEGLDGFDLPMAVIPGNHDLHDTFAAAFANGSYRAGAGEFLHLTIDDWRLRLIGLDTMGEPGGTQGLLCEDRLDWIAARLDEAPDRDTLIFMHHPPFATGIGFMDATACVNGDRLAALVARHGHVLRVTCGHVHRPAHVAFGGTVASICPGIAYQAALRLAPARRMRLTYQPPAYQLHVWSPEFGLVTHTHYLRAETEHR